MDADIEQLLPHRRPMIMIDELVSCEHDSAVAVKCFDDNDFGVFGGIVLEPLLVEAMAQTVAAMDGEGRRQKGEEPSPGMLVGVNDFDFISSAITGQQLEISVKIDKVLGQFRIASGTIYQSGKLITKGEMKFYVNDQ